MKIILFLLLISISIFYCNKTIFVFEHFRHGARSPLFYMSSNFTDSLNIQWDNKDGEINNIGKKQHFLSGYQKLKKYKHLLEDPLNVICHTTNLSRTKTSLKYHLLGIYNYSKMINKENINNFYFIPKNLSTYKNLNFTFDKKYDNITYTNVNKNIKIEIFESNKIMYRTKVCPYLIEIRKEYNLKAKNLYDNIINKFNKKYLNEIKNYLNNNSFGFYNFKHLTRICDTYISDYIYNESNFYNKFKNINLIELYEDCLNVMNVSMYNTYYVNDYNVVPIANNFLKSFHKFLKNAKIKNTIDNNYIKYFMFSGHDSSFASINIFFKYIFNNDINIKTFYPFLGTSIIFELNKIGNNNEYYIKCLVDDEIVFEMNYDKFINKFDKYILSDEEIYNYCYNIRLFNYKNIVVIIIAILFFICLICILRNNKDKKKQINNDKNEKELEDKFI